jgi:hypothetical protein
MRAPTAEWFGICSGAGGFGLGAWRRSKIEGGGKACRI